MIHKIGTFSGFRNLPDNLDPDLISSRKTEFNHGIKSRKNKNTHLNDFDFRKTLVVSISQNSDELRVRAVKSNRLRFDSIFDREVAETFRFDSKNDSIRYKTAPAFMKEKWPSGKWLVFIRFAHYKGINISKSLLRFCLYIFFIFPVSI